MLALNLRTIKLYDRLQADGVEFEMHEKGILFAFLDEQGLDQEFAELGKIEQHGFPVPQRLDRDLMQSLEPKLSDRVVGGVLLPAERHVQPRSLSLGLVGHLREAGVEFVTSTRVDGFDLRGGKITAAYAQGTRIGGDLFVLTAGVWTRQLAAMVNVNLPLEAGKGYSLTLSATGDPFRHALYFGDTKVVLSQYRDEVRIAGTMEFSGYNTRLDAKRVQGLRKATARYLRAELHDEHEQAWTGMRPMTPDGMPIMGRIPGVSNAFVSTGHSMNGIFMAPVSGEALAQLVVQGKSVVDIGAFDPLRFASR
jgi:D-amino-acid dehydrogenase